ncbi:MAG: methyl-accepting chemotaxis protein [Treponema sp.]|jgi:methyl-accepting chemotaxis protein|nr:methyl-accepting chemotaxis protein [Treponema sp.]
MKMSIRVSLLIGILVLFVSLSTGITALLISSNIVQRSAENSLSTQAALGAGWISSMVSDTLRILEELATRQRVQAMDYETQRAALLGDIDRLGYMDLGIVVPDGTATNIKEPTVSHLADRDYVQKAFAGQATVSDVIISRVVNTPVAMFSVPIRQDGRVVGVLIGRRNGIQLMDMIKAANLGFGQQGYAYMINLSGVFVAHANNDYVLNQFNPIEEANKDTSLKSLARAVSEMISKKKGLTEYQYKGQKIIAAYTPVEGFPWILVTTAAEAEMNAEVQYLRTFIIVSVIIFIALGLGIAIIIAHSVSRPILKMLPTLKKIAAGDLTEQFTVNSKDEIGELAHEFNLTIENIKKLASVIQDRAMSLSGIGNELAVNMSETASAIVQINANIESIKVRALNQSASVTETNATMKQITVNIDTLNEQVEHQSESVAQSSAAVEEMLASINSVIQTLIQNGKDMKGLANASEAGRTGLQEVAGDIQQIARQSEGLLEINAVMQNIASQTNLLSMNAAIEAAHAGEAGKGFAVVADEIRKLAENSGEQSKTISTVLKQIKESIEKITTSTEKVLHEFESINSGVKMVSSQAENIRIAMEEEGKGSKQILDAIANLNDITQTVKNSSEEMLEGSKEVISESNNLEHVTREITNGMEEMAAGAGQVNIAVTRVNEISIKNKEDINTLVKEVSRFKLV